jgi:hypothetical protein
MVRGRKPMGIPFSEGGWGAFSFRKAILNVVQDGTMMKFVATSCKGPNLTKEREWTSRHFVSGWIPITFSSS